MVQRTKEDSVADFLREGIISGRFPRGTKLKQVEIADMLGTSITPVREALKLLEAEGYVLGASHRGAVVAPFEAESAKEILDLRKSLEGKLLLAAIERQKAGDADRLVALHLDLEAAVARGDRNAVRLLNYRFHQHLYTIAALPQTLAFVRILWARYPFDLINEIGGRIERTAAEHRNILEAFLAKDSVAALTALSAHIGAGWQELKHALEKSAATAANTTAGPAAQDGSRISRAPPWRQQ